MKILRKPVRKQFNLHFQSLAFPYMCGRELGCSRRLDVKWVSVHARLIVLSGAVRSTKQAICASAC